MEKILPLTNPIMDYAWGSRVHIPQLMSEPTPSDRPQAELWMGAHPKAPSRVGDKTLVDLIDTDPVGMLGEDIAARYGNRLPFLLKLLAAGTPLSIQAHPNKVQAEQGFAAEEAKGVALDAPNRNYRDDNHKPEILCALTDFWVLNGFREKRQLVSLLDEAGLDALTQEITALRNSQGRDGLREFFKTIVELDGTRKIQMLGQLVAIANRLESKRPEYQWIKRISALYPGDVGVLSVLLLNLVKLEPGQAMFCAAGDLHAYLEGFGVELMANSDNVLRGGLTPKHVDIPELMRTLTFADRALEVIEPRNGVYPTPAEEFELSVTRLDGGPVKRFSRGFEILINVAGDASISMPAGGESVPLPQGAAVAIPAGVRECVLEGCATVYGASTPTS